MGWLRISHYIHSFTYNGAHIHAPMPDGFRKHLRHVMRKHGQPDGLKLCKRHHSQRQSCGKLCNGLPVGNVHARHYRTTDNRIILIKRFKVFTETSQYSSKNLELFYRYARRKISHQTVRMCIRKDDRGLKRLGLFKIHEGV